MKKLIILITMCFVLSGCSLLPKINFHTPFLFPKYVDNPHTLSDWFRKDFKYEYDITNHWKSPHETIRDKAGDCEDMAILTKYILKKKGYDVCLIGIYYKNKNIGHVIALIRNADKTYSYMSNKDFVSIKFKTIRELFDHESKSYNPRRNMEWEIAWLLVTKKIRPRFWRNKK